MPTWASFEREAPELGAAGRRLLGADQIPIGFLATVSRAGRPRIAPVCPIFARDDVYVSIAAGTLKGSDLARGGSYALHAFLGRGDEEFRFSGAASEVIDAGERAAVIGAIKFGAYNSTHPIFRLDVGSCLWVAWENPGTPQTRAIRKRWQAPTALAGS